MRRRGGGVTALHSAAVSTGPIYPPLGSSVISTRPYLAILGFTSPYIVLLCLTLPSFALLRLTSLYKALSGSYWAPLELTGPYWAFFNLVTNKLTY